MSLWTENDLQEFAQNVVPLISRKGVDALAAYQSNPKSIIDDILRSAEEPRLTSKHRIASFSALAGFLEQGIRNGGSMKQCCTTSDVFQRALQIYLDRSDGFTSGPMQRLLSALANILRQQSPEISQKNVKNASLQCLTKIMDHDDPNGAKPSMLLLTKFLTQECLSPQQLLLHLSEISGTTFDGSTEFDRLGHLFIYNILEWIGLHHASISATNLICRFCKLCEHTEAPHHPTFQSANLWLAPVRQLLSEDESMMEMLERHALPNLFRINIQYTSDALKPILERLCRSHGKGMSDLEVRLCLMALRKVGPKETFMETRTVKMNSISVLTSRHTMVTQIAMHLLIHRSSKIRITALDLITGAYKLPHHMPGEVLDNIIKALSGFHAEGEAHVRTEFLNIARKLITRIEASVVRLQRDIDTLEEAAHDDNNREAARELRDVNLEKLKEHERFIIAYSVILTAGLKASAPYQQHISCLKMMEVLADSSRNLKWNATLCYPQVQTLLTLVLDPYDDVRASASVTISRMLCNAPSYALGVQLHKMLLDAVSSAEKTMCRAQRADLADGYGQLNSLFYEACPDPLGHVESLLQKLENDISAARADLNAAVASAPIQGHLIALRCILSRKDIGRAFGAPVPETALKNFHRRLRITFHQVWEVVRPILCADFIDSSNQPDPEAAVETGIKDTLSYAWRALKEISSLMQVVVSGSASEVYARCGELQYESYKTIGDLTILQLAQLRHRGAFSTVSQTFTACCIVCSKSNDKRVLELVDGWYQEMLQCIELKANALTKRSAGIPNIAIGVLIARNNQGLIDHAFKDLLMIAQQRVQEVAPFSDSRLPQVHALNCLKEAASHTHLGPAIEPHIPELTQLAAHCLESQIWAMRNCGLMLLKVLITRLANESNTSSARSADKYRTYAKTTYEKFPKISELVVELLTRSSLLMQDVKTVNDQDFLCENGLPALQIISRLGIVPRDRSRIKLLLAKHLQSRIWNIRVLTGRSLSTIGSLDEIFMAITASFDDSEATTNIIHGYLACLREYLQSHPDQAEAALRGLFLLGARIVTPSACPFVLTAYLQNVCFAMRKCYEVPQAKIVTVKDIPSITSQPTTSLPTKQDLQKRLADLTVGEMPAEVLEAIVSTAALLRRCDFPVSDYRTLYPLAPYHSPVEDIPGLASISLFDCSATTHNDLAAIRASLDLYVALKGRNSAPQSCNQVLEWISNSISVYAFQTSYHASYGLQHDDIRSTRLRLRSLSDAMMESGHYETDEIYAQQLIFHGAVLSWEKIHESDEPYLTKLRRLRRYAAMLQLALEPDAEYVERYAAVTSMGHYLPSLALSDLPNEVLDVAVKLYTLLLTSLSDDDDEMRYAAADVVYSSIPRQTSLKHCGPSEDYQTSETLHCPFDPVAAKGALMSMLTEGTGINPRYLGHCISAVIGEEIDPAWAIDDGKAEISLDEHIESASSRFAVLVREKESLLFEEERIILFLDEVDDMSLWNTAFKRCWGILTSRQLSFGSNWIVTETERWVLPGLKAMKDYVERNGAANLTASSTREVFVFGMRLLLLAEALIYVSRTYLKKDLESISMALEELRDTGEMHEIDDYWKQTILATLSVSD